MHYEDTHFESISMMRNGWKRSRPLPVQRRTSKNRKVFAGGPSGVTRGENRKFKDSSPSVAAKGVQKQYSAKEKAHYKARKAGERKVKKEGWVGPTREVKHVVWAEAHESVDQKVLDKRKKDNECTRCGMINHTWKFSGQAVTSIGRILKSDKAQTTSLIRTKTTPPGSLCGSR